MSPSTQKPRVSPKDTKNSDAHSPQGEGDVRMTDAPHKKKKKKEKGKGGEMQQRQPEKKSESGINSAENNNDIEMENVDVTPQ